MPTLSTVTSAPAPSGGGVLLVFALVFLTVAVASIAAMWKVFEKGGEPGWAALVPIYNVMKIAEIAGRPAWWGLLTLIPFVGIIFGILLSIELGAMFGKSAVWSLFLLIFVPVGWFILGFGSATYGDGAPPVASPYA